MKLAASIVCSIAAGALLAATSTAQYGITVRASTSATGGAANGSSASCSMSDDGRYVAFDSYASDLLPPGVDTNGVWDVFVLDRQTGSTRRVSMGLGGFEADDVSFQPSISADGARVAFVSLATNLVAGDTNFDYDVFVVDVATLVTRRVSVSTFAAQANSWSQFPAISGDGRRVTFESEASNLSPFDGKFNIDVFWHDIASGVTHLVSRRPSGVTGNGDSIGDFHDGPSISFDGNLVAFCSESSNLVPGDTNGTSGGPQACTSCGIDVFVHDLTTFSTVRVSVSSAGGQGRFGSMHPSISGNGRWVAFTSRADDLVPNDTNVATDIFVHDRDVDHDGIFDESGQIETRRVSVSGAGVQGDSYSGGGGFGWRGPELSRDGARVAFTSAATNLVSGDTNGHWDLFVHDLAAGSTHCASLTPAGTTGDFHSYAPTFSADGSLVAFSSQASDLVPGDTNQLTDVFVRTECTPPRTYCTAKTNSLGCTPSIATIGVASASFPGAFVVHASNLRNRVTGLLAFTIAGPKFTPFVGGVLCLRAPISRAGVLSSGGSATGWDCTGTLAFDFNAFLRTGVHPVIVDGVQVWAQFWSRDPGDPFGINLTDAVAFTLCAQ